MLAAALASTAVNAGSGLEQMLTDKLMDYAGLSEETDKVDLAGTEADAPPRVKTFGYETTQISDNGLVGYEVGLNADLGWSYELPLYN